jgi:hypothetical protein
MMQVLAPGMEHGDEADLGTEVTRIGSDRAQCFGRRPEQDAGAKRASTTSNVRMLFCDVRRPSACSS